MRADLAMAIHFHQPVGNFGHVMERACDKCYLPFIDLLKKYPGIKMSFHFTGCLLEWAEGERPELIEALRELARSGQIEVMTGGFYEPILPSIPRRDRIAQIKKLTKYVSKEFSCDPSGAWIAERVWEPGLPADLYDAGVKYVMLDDTHFLYAGIDKQNTYGYYMTEDSGKTVAVFPTDKTLRYQIPFKMPSDCMDYIKWVMSRKKDPLLIYGDDGEKFGEWPGTHKWVFGEKWLEKFFDEIMANRSWLNTVKAGDCLKERAPEGRVYLPTTSYEEMLEWALPADKQQYMQDVLNDIRSSGKEEFYKPFIRGGFWRNFLSKYPESNDMNKKMIYVSNKLNKAEQEHGVKALEKARDDLFRGQCNCAYWHGEFGGIYLFHLRRAIYHHLIKSEKAIDDLIHGGSDFCEAEIIDINADGHQEVVMYNRGLSLAVYPAEGGVVKELDHRGISHNLMNTLSRRKEAYHGKIIEKIRQQDAEKKKSNEGVTTIHEGDKHVASGIKENIVYDRHGRNSFIDHFLDKGTGLEEMLCAAYKEQGDFVEGIYSADVKKEDDHVSLVLRRNGKVSGNGISVTKTIFLPGKGGEVSVRYLIKNTGGDVLDSVFGPEMNFALPDGDAEKYSIVLEDSKRGHGLGVELKKQDVKKISISDKEKECCIEIELSCPCDLWCFPVKTVSQSEKAYELNYQGSAIFPHFPLKLSPGKEKEFEVNIKIAGRVERSKP